MEQLLIVRDWELYLLETLALELQCSRIRPLHGILGITAYLTFTKGDPSCVEKFLYVGDNGSKHNSTSRQSSFLDFKPKQTNM